MIRWLAILAILTGPLVPGPPAEAESSAFRGIRPGTWMTAPALCTMNFIFNATGRLSDGGPFYIGTAKHCVGRVGRPVELSLVLDGTSPVAMRVGEVSHVTKGATLPDRDFALVRIDPALEHLISPSMAVVGGPTSVMSDAIDAPIVMVGHGAGIGTGGRARLGRLVCRCPDDAEHGWGAVMPVIAGDSGSPVRTLDGAAVGNVVYDAVNYYAMRRGQIPPGGATVLGTRASHVAAGWGLHVVTCSTTTPWPGFGCPPG